MISTLSFSQSTILFCTICTFFCKLCAQKMAQQLDSPFLSFRVTPSSNFKRSGRKIIHPLDPGQSPFHSPNFLGGTANLGDPCNLTFHTHYADKIFQQMLDGSSTTQLEQELAQFLLENPAYRPLSCFGYTPFQFPKGEFTSIVNFYDCDEVTETCTCLQKGLLNHQHDPFVPTGCKIRDCQRGDPCDHDLYQHLFKIVYEPAFLRLKRARGQLEHEKGAEYFYEHRGQFYLLDDANYVNQRRVCKSENLELECTSSNVCGCRSWLPHFSFSVKKKSRKKCIADPGTWCFPLASDIKYKKEKRKYSDRKSFCKEDSPCEYLFKNYTRLAACGGTRAWCKNKEDVAKIGCTFDRNSANNYYYYFEQSFSISYLIILLTHSFT